MPEKLEESPLRRISGEVGDPGLFPPEVHQHWEAGRRLKAQATLRARLRAEPNPGRRERQRQHAEDPWLWLEPIQRAPSLHTINGIGSMLYGHHRPGPDGLHVATLWFVLVFLPIFPIAAYAVRKGEGNTWHFFGRTPLPPLARTWRWGTALAATAALLGATGWVAWDRSHTALSIYNGFDRPLTVQVGERTLEVAPGALAHAPQQREGVLQLSATPEGWAVPIDALDLDLAAEPSDHVLYNPAGRASLVRGNILYGSGQPAEDQLLGTPRILAVDDVDHLLRDPPETRKIREGSTVVEALLYDMERDLPFEVAVMVSASSVGTEDAVRMASAELALHPGSQQAFAALLRLVPFGSPALAAVGDLARRGTPNEIEAHRLYQTLAPSGNGEALEREYRELLARHPGEARWSYLLARALAAALDPERDAITRCKAEVFLALATGDRAALDAALTTHAELIPSIGASFALLAGAGAQAIRHPSAEALATAARNTPGRPEENPAIALAPEADLSTPEALDALIEGLSLDARPWTWQAAAILIRFGDRGGEPALAHALAQAARYGLPDELPQ